MSAGPVREVAADAVVALAARVLGERAASRFVADTLTDAPDGDAAFSYAASGGVVRISATDTPTATAALHHYLRTACGAQITWETPTAHELPDPLPDAPTTTRATPAVVRYHLNVVTTGYSAPYWHWDRWEREIDWMALHGVTMPLMVVGHEAVLARTFAMLGVDDAAVAAWLGSAAHLPWTLMGSTSGFGGPLPASWHERRLDLARRILERQRELGMRPVLPTFGGHVPDALAGPATPRTQWQGFSTALLDAADPAFAEVAAAFARVQREVLGTDHLYAADPLIESVPPSGDPAALAAHAGATFAGMHAADPDAIWVMQAWPFHFHRRFWTSERVAAFVGAVPEDRLLLLDLWAEHAPVWNDGRGVADRDWVWCAVHNFGGRFSVHGDLHGLARDLGDVLDAARAGAPAVGAFRGTGLATEAVENNTPFYELATELVWDRPDVETWALGYADRRYRLDRRSRDLREAAHEAWRILLRTLYGPGMTRSIPSPLIARPWDVHTPFRSQRLAGELLDPDAPISANIDAESDPRVEADLPEIARAARLLLGVATACEDPTGGPAGHDVTDLIIHLVAQRSRVAIRQISTAGAAGAADAVRAAGATLQRALVDLDRLAATQPDRLLGSWLTGALSWGETPDEQAVLLRDARRLLTVWGEQTSGLQDYAGRHWSGLLSGFYAPRWQLWVEWFAAAATAGRAPDPQQLRAAVVGFEDAWIDRDGLGPTRTTGDLVTVAEQLLAAHG